MSATIAGAIIRLAEGLRLEAYQDSGGVWSIGFGHTADVQPGDICTVEQAAAWLVADSAPLFALVSDKPPIAAGAYVSFGYNLGFSVLQRVLQTNESLLPFCHVHGQIVPGLQARRALEQTLIDAST